MSAIGQSTVCADVAHFPPPHLEEAPRIASSTKPSGYVIRPVQSRQIEAIWPCVCSLVEEACVGPEEFRVATLDDIRAVLASTDSQLWLVVDQRTDAPDLAGVVVTTVHVYPRLKAIEGSIAGRNFMSWRPELERVLGEWGRQIGASHFLVQTAHEALKALFRRRGYAELSSIFVKELPDHG